MTPVVDSRAVKRGERAAKLAATKEGITSKEGVSAVSTVEASVDPVPIPPPPDSNGLTGTVRAVMPSGVKISVVAPTPAGPVPIINPPPRMQLSVQLISTDKEFLQDYAEVGRPGPDEDARPVGYPDVFMPLSGVGMLLHRRAVILDVWPYQIHGGEDKDERIQPGEMVLGEHLAHEMGEFSGNKSEIRRIRRKLC